VLSCDVLSNRSIRGFGAEMVVLGGSEGEVGVDGSSEMDGDGAECWERSARTTSAGVPLVFVSLKGRIWGADIQISVSWSSENAVVGSRGLGFIRFERLRG
jgi:hypothetical protein